MVSFQRIGGLHHRHDWQHLFPKNLIFFHQILDDLLLMLVHPTSNGDDEKGDGRKPCALLQVIMQSVMLPPFQ